MPFWKLRVIKAFVIKMVVKKKKARFLIKNLAF